LPLTREVLRIEKVVYRAESPASTAELWVFNSGVVDQLGRRLFIKRTCEYDTNPTKNLKIT
jgi:hypothetical protein